ncbi:MAG: hypothetical protein CL484_10460 [Acidobacteria bacterium]|nr:hypothetical protein [Acidobacteriota bacterium]
MPTLRTWPTTVALALLASYTASGCIDQNDPGRSLDPEKFIASTILPDDLSLELAASEPAVVDPVGIAFDADGAMYVVEMGGYPIRPDESLPLGRIKRLVDKDLDGYYESWTLFADGLQYPTSVLPWRDGILVAQPPDILFLRDDDEDGSADSQETLFSGFPVGNTQHNINGLVWGLDNWVYAANGGNHGAGYSTKAPHEVVSIRGMDFRFRPDTGELETSYETTGGHGITFDPWGRMFGTHNINHVQHVVFSSHYLSRNPWLKVPTLRHMISDHGSSARLFQASDAETRVNNPQQSGRFSGGAGITFYGGGSLPPAYEGSLFVNDVVVNVVHQDVLHATGASFTATRSADNTEFLAGSDNWFRPVSAATGPEGALYVVDMHRAVIEHPEWIPDTVEARLDLRTGDDKGRIYRVVPAAGLPMVSPGLASADPARLVEGLTNRNKWWRDTAQRILVERGNTEAVDLLNDLLATTDVDVGRLHALWTLRGLSSLKTEQIAIALSDPVAGVRENAVALAERSIGTSHSLLQAVISRANDPDPRVRMQVALTLSTLDRPEASNSLQKLLARDAESQWTRYATLAGLRRETGAVLRALLLPDDGLATSPTGPGLLDAVRHLGATATGNDELNAMLRLARNHELDDPTRAALLDGLADGLSSTNPALTGEIDPTNLTPLLQAENAEILRSALRIASAIESDQLPARTRAMERALTRVLDDGLHIDIRIQEVELLALGDYEQVGKTLLLLMEPQFPPELQLAAAQALTSLDAADRGQATLTRWRSFGAEVKGIVLEMLLRNRPFHGLLVNALESGDLTTGELNLDFGQRRQLLRRSTDDIQVRVSALFGDHEYSNRQTMVDEWLPEIIGRRGNATRGAEHFQALCAQCHLFGNTGHSVGPDLGMAFAKGKEDLLTSILDPSAAVAPEYANYLVETADGELLDGILRTETAVSVTLARANGETDTIERSRIQSISTEGRSLMPDGLEQGLDASGLADLLAYLRQHDH